MKIPTVLAIVCFAIIAAVAQQSPKTIEGVMYPVPPATTSGSGYTAIECGLDGKVYVGTANYGDSAHLVRFDPKTKQWDDLIDAHKVTRHSATGLDSHSKFHAKILVDARPGGRADGTIWAATKQGNEEFVNRPEYGENPTGYPGGHLFSYNPKTGAVRDHGILKKQEGIMGGAIDCARQRLYYWSDPKQHFLIYDIATNAVRDLGSIGGSPRYMVIDAQGRVFVPGRKGVLCMYDPKTDELFDLAVQLQGPGTYVDPYVIVLSADGKSILGCAIGGEYVMEFDLGSVVAAGFMPAVRKASQAAGKQLERSVSIGNTLGPAGIKPAATTSTSTSTTNGTIICRHPARSISEPEKPGDQHAGCLGKDGCFYFPNVPARDPHLIRYDPKRKIADDLGVITIKGQPDLKPTAAQGACVGTDGTLYLKFISYQKTPYCIVAFEKLTAGR